jgi:hypothetical protein
VSRVPRPWLRTLCGTSIGEAVSEATEMARGIPERLSAVFAGLDAAAVPWALLRGDPAALRATDDVDLLVSRRHLSRYGRLVHSAGFTVAPGGRGTHRFAEYRAGDTVVLKLDVVTELAFGPGFVFSLPVAHRCLARRVRDGHAHRLAPDDEFWATLLHQLLDKAHLDPDAWWRLQEVSSRVGTNGPVAVALEGVLPDRWSSARVLGSVQHGRADELESLRRPLRRHWRRMAPVAVTGRQARAAGQRVSAALRRRVHLASNVQRRRVRPTGPVGGDATRHG